MTPSPGFRSLRALALASVGGFVLAVPWMGPPARAACNPVGSTTTRTDTSGGGTVGFGPSGDGETVINLGTLTGTTFGIELDGNNNTTVQNSGTISGGTTGIDIFFGNNNTITNDGTITGGSNGIAVV